MTEDNNIDIAEDGGMRGATSAAVYPRQSIERKIGFDTIRAMVTARCTSPQARALSRTSMQWSSDATEVRRRLYRVYEMTQALGGDDVPDIGTVEDLQLTLKSMAVPGTFVEASELLRLLKALRQAARVQSWFERKDSSDRPLYPHLREITVEMDTAPAVQRVIASMVDDLGQVRDNASKELADIRREMSTIQRRMASAMRRVLSDAVAQGWVQPDATPAMRDGRLVIPVAPMNKRLVQGIVHDESATGKTVYIEPAAVVELGNRGRQLEIEERREVVRLLVAAADEIRPHLEPLLDLNARLGLMDFIVAKARVAAEGNCAMPRLSDTPCIELRGARHLTLEAALRRHGRSIVPLDVCLDAAHRILVISGPNAGGKSIALKTVAVSQYMLQCGLLPAVDADSRMGVMQRLMVDIGDDQSMDDDLSTYSSHLLTMKYMLEHGNAATLFVIDEFGSGTEPQIGGAIAQALLTRFNAAGMWGVVTTHYQNLKTLASEVDGLVNGSMLYDRQRMQPLFRLDIGHPGSSFAIEIARKTGLPSSVIDDACAIVGSDYVNLDKYLLDIARDKRYWANKREDMRRRHKHLEEVIARYQSKQEDLDSRTRTILDEARQEGLRIVSESNAAVERTIRDIKEAQAERENTLRARERLREQRERLENAVNEPSASDTPSAKAAKRGERPSRHVKDKNAQQHTAEQTPKAVEPGAFVLLDGQGQPGRVLSIDGKKAMVAFGALKMTVALSRLSVTMRRPAKGGVAQAASFLSVSSGEDIRRRQLSFNPEIDLRGFRADEALQAVMHFIDDAVQFSAGRVRILHGTGTGALRTAIRQYLDTIPAVVSYADEDVRFGGAGITVVNLGE